MHGRRNAFQHKLAHKISRSALLLKINGAAAASQSIPTGGSFCWANPAVAGSTPITAMSLTTTAIQSGAGRIVYHLFGDPT